MHNFHLNIRILILVFFISSCSTVKDTLFGDKIKKKNSIPVEAISLSELKNIKEFRQIISPGDLLFIRNLQNETQVLGYISGASGQSTSAEYTVEVDSLVTLPFLGVVKLGGMSIPEAEAYLNKAYAKTLLKDPIIKIFISNLKVTLLGEFAKQGNIPLKKNYTHLTEVLGDAGGLTLKADASRIKIIRGDLKNPEVIQVNLRNIKSLGDSRLFLRNNDILYVDIKPSAKFFDELNSARTLVGIAVSILSVYLITERIR
jgi:polysaccharide export outer membrane protein